MGLLIAKVKSRHLPVIKRYLVLIKLDLIVIIYIDIYYISILNTHGI